MFSLPKEHKDGALENLGKYLTRKFSIPLAAVHSNKKKTCSRAVGLSWVDKAASSTDNRMLLFFS
jgi:hypothetical protein